jgi:tetratricopeptide (TPR) repeat protein
MKKLLSWVIVLCILLFFMMNFSACQSLKISNLKANDHFKKGNGFYTKEQYKKAVDEYEKALEYNPDLKIAFFYLGTACSRSYKAGIEPPERNEEYNTKIQQNDQLKVQIEEHNAFINDFINSNPEFAGKLKENRELRKKIQETEKEMSFIRGYEGYLELRSDNEEYNRRIKVNDEYVKRLKEEMDATKKGAEGEETIAEEEFKTEDEQTPSTEIEELLKEKEDLKGKVKDNEVAIENFEKNEEFQRLSTVKKNYFNMIKQNEEFLKSFDGYGEYKNKVETRDNYIKITSTNENYINRVAENETFRKKAIEYLIKAREVQPNDERVVLALSEIYDKMGDFEEAE